MRRLAMLALLMGALPNAPALAASQTHSHAQAVIYTCPMHPDLRETKAGSCPRCAMALVRVSPDRSTATYRLALDSGPEPIQAGRPFELTLVVHGDGGDAIVKDLAVVHEKPFHLFVISQDLQHYLHVHPVQRDDGAWTHELILPSPGEYHVYADILPSGAKPQLLRSRLRVEGGVGEAAAGAPLVADRDLERTIGQIRVRLSVPPGGLTAGDHQSLRFDFSHAETGIAIQDLQPYLGAWGHTVMLSSDAQHFVHAHPEEALSTGRGGPRLTFHAAPPVPGLYRVWTQVMRNGRVETIVFTLPVRAAR